MKKKPAPAMSKDEKYTNAIDALARLVLSQMQRKQAQSQQAKKTA